MSVRAAVATLAAGLVTSAVLVAAPAPAVADTTFSCSGSAQTWVVPTGVTVATFDLLGAKGGNASPSGQHLGGQGGHVTATIPVTPGETLTINAGCAGHNGAAHGAPGAGGFGGDSGGRGGFADFSGAGGGGSSDVRQGGTGEGDRVVVAGGGGGAGPAFLPPNGGGGSGGGSSGTAGDNGATMFTVVNGGSGGTQLGAGAGGTGFSTPTSDGANGSGGSGGAGGSVPTSPSNGGGGGGGGYFGGGGGGGDRLNNAAGGGGGGSGFVEASATNVTNVQGGGSGNGSVTISWVTLSPTTLPNWTVNQPGYSQTIAPTGGTSPATLALSGTIPTGMNFTSSTGVLAGTPTAVGTFNFTITATDALGDTTAQPYSITINTATITLAPPTLPDWTLNQPGYNQIVTTTGGTPPMTFSVMPGSLPTGLHLDTSAGIVSGTPTAAGPFSFTINATDTAGATASHNYSVTINPTVAVSPPNLPNGTVGSAYNQTVTSSGGTGTTAFTVTTGTLPTGLNLDTSTGVISGTPTTSGLFGFTVTATDTVGATGSQAYSVTVGAASTTTVLSAGPSPATFGKPIMLTAIVHGPSGVGPPTGMVTFSDGVTTLGPAALTGGTATFTISTLGAGTHQLEAHYGGDNNFLSSDATAVALPVNQHAVSVTLTSSSNPAAGGQPVALSATVNATADPPTGTITFFDGSTSLATVPLNTNQQAGLEPLLAPGTHLLTTHYSGDENFSAADSATLIQVIGPVAVTAIPRFTG